MRFVGVIAEYNPFHNGHAWQLAQLHAAGAQTVAVAMSSGAVNNMFNGVFTSENAIIRFVVDHLAGCAIGSLAVMLLGGWIRKAAK